VSEVPKYLFQSRYTQEGARGFLKEGGTKRRTETQRAVESVGGKLESFYYAFGGMDMFIVADLPDHASAASLSLTVAASGTISTETIVLLAPEELDQLTSKGVAYRPPGE
jgi:uncharacterized protein with GYD domain